ncbi:glycosyltransferase family 4 protein [Flammeovirgaceae bacterium SG7u.111]|nr:glycosyltransferase family 4 protein [Flammeovirgaceae bacterium SG7u.132]WPO35975.1 glycosyltransferase family 4 protein [Flammeovirgaceae bacterium SG7u.111]
MKKIAFLNTSIGWGGLELNTIKLAKAFVEKGWEIALVTAEGSKMFEEGKECFSTSLFLQKTKKYFDFSNAKKIAVFLKAEGYDGVFMTDNRDIDLANWAKRIYFKELKVFYQQQMQMAIRKKDILHTLRYKSIDAWISPLSWLKNQVVEQTKFPEERISVIPLCVESDRYTKSKFSKIGARKELEINPKGMLLGIIGRIDPQKGQRFVTDAFIELRKQGVEVELLIFGSPTLNEEASKQYYDGIKELIAENGVEKFVHFRKFSPQPELFYSAVDVFTIASLSETFGMVTVEAMLSKLPILAANTGGSPEILRFGKFGQLFEYENVKDFCSKFNWVVNNPEKVKKMVEASQAYALEKFDISVEVDGIESLFMKHLPHVS